MTVGLMPTIEKRVACVIFSLGCPNEACKNTLYPYTCEVQSRVCVLSEVPRDAKI